MNKNEFKFRAVAVKNLPVPSRQYYAYEDPHRAGHFNAAFQPLNPKTGKPWQASHSIYEGRDIQVPCTNGYIGTWDYYSSLEKAIEACRAHCAKSKLLEVA